MVTKIQLHVTPEAYDTIDALFYRTCNSNEQTLSQIRVAYTAFEENLTSLKADITGQYTDYANFLSTLGAGGVISYMQTAMDVNFHQPFTDIFANTAWQQTTGHLSAQLGFCTQKLEGFDHFVGVTVSEENIDQHLVDHEGISSDESDNFILTYNQWMRDNSDIFDVFLDGLTIDETVEAIKAL
jgi:hypothetical protein